MLTDITDLSDAGLALFLQVKGGDTDCLILEGIAESEIRWIFRKCGIAAPEWYFSATSSKPEPRGNYAERIMAEQDRRFPSL